MLEMRSMQMEAMAKAKPVQAPAEAGRRAFGNALQAVDKR